MKLTSRAAANDPRSVELRRRIAKYEDAGHGACFLRDARVVRVVENGLLHFDGQRYRLFSWCVMPNHVHALAETRDGWPLDRVVHSWKSFTSKEVNKLLEREGRLWSPEYHDRFIRDERHFLAEIAYIEQNPVKAGLCLTPEQWPFSSASRRR